MSTIQDIFREHRQDYLRQFGGGMPAGHRQALAAICACRSGACGHHLFACPDCGTIHVARSSCGNRHCPVCQNEKAARWVYQQQLRLLPCAYFLATFTIPDELRAVARNHPRVVYDALLSEASASLRTLEADPRFVGCNVAGFFGVLHTWGKQLQYHPHIHYIVTGGALSKSDDEWHPSRLNFYLPVKTMSVHPWLQATHGLISSARPSLAFSGLPFTSGRFSYKWTPSG